MKSSFCLTVLLRYLPSIKHQRETFPLVGHHSALIMRHSTASTNSNHLTLGLKKNHCQSELLSRCFANTQVERDPQTSRTDINESVTDKTNAYQMCTAQAGIFSQTWHDWHSFSADVRSLICVQGCILFLFSLQVTRTEGFPKIPTATTNFHVQSIHLQFVPSLQRRSNNIKLTAACATKRHLKTFKTFTQFNKQTVTSR